MEPEDVEALRVLHDYYALIPVLWFCKFQRNIVLWRDRQMSLIVLLVCPYTMLPDRLAIEASHTPIHPHARTCDVRIDIACSLCQCTVASWCFCCFG
jgi:hypothetical protein